MEKEYWEGKHFAFHQNKQCEYFPCHKIKDVEQFNCLFCYCPLYVLGKDCGGTPVFLEDGTKDCSKCIHPHLKANYGKINDRYFDIVKAMKQD